MSRRRRSANDRQLTGVRERVGFRMRARRGREVCGLVMAAALLVVGGLATASSAGATPVPENGNPGQLVLAADPFPLGTHDMPPGGVVRWTITASVDQVAGATLSLAVVGHGVMALDPAGLTLAVDWCSTGWAVPADTALPAVCPSGDRRTVLAASPIASITAGNRTIGRLAAAAPSHLLVTAALPVSAGTRFVNDSGDVDLVFQAAGDTETVEIGSPRRLVTTGSPIAGPALLAAGLLLAGLTLAGIRGRRLRSREAVRVR